MNGIIGQQPNARTNLAINLRLFVLAAATIGFVVVEASAQAPPRRTEAADRTAPQNTRRQARPPARQSRPQPRRVTSAQPNTGQPNRSRATAPQTRKGASNARSSRTPVTRNQPARNPGKTINRNSPRLAQLPKRTRNLPKGHPLTLEQQKRVDKILNYWETQTASIKTFHATFRRLEYDAVMGPKGKPSAIADGTLKFGSPDKALMIDDKVFGYSPPKSKDEKEYKLMPEAFNQHWLCDGNAIFIKNYRTKVMTEQILPEEMRGKAIAEGPLPFLFGAKADTMKKRFWIREVPPPSKPGEKANGKYYLEAIPKTRSDAADYERIVVIMERVGKQLLPSRMRITVRSNKAAGRYDDYTFASHRVNDTRDRVAGFFRSFVKPELPKGWKRETRDSNMSPVHKPVASRGKSNPKQARRTSPNTKRPAMARRPQRSIESSSSGTKQR